MAFFRPQSRSSAIKIVAPNQDPLPETSDAVLRGSSPKKDSTHRQCRNILIHGYCKFEGKGCAYYHPSRGDTGSPVPEQSTSTTSPSLPAAAVNAPVFVPKSILSASPAPPDIGDTIERPGAPPPPLPQGQGQSQMQYQNEYTEQGQESQYAEQIDDQGQYGQYAYGWNGGADENPYAMEGVANQLPSLDTGQYGDAQDQHMHMQPEYNGVGVGAMDAFYHPNTTSYIRQPLNYHLYTTPIPPTAQQFFLSESTREELLKRAETIHMPPPQGLPLPEKMQGYHSLAPLEPMAGEQKRKLGNWNSTVYRATSERDGVVYALRRVENFRLTQESAFANVEAWSRIQHPNICDVREAFTTRAFNDNSLVVVYTYYPNSVTLYDAHLKLRPPTFQNGRVQHHNERIPERLLWSYIVQIGSAIKAVHDAGLCVRTVDASKILVTGKNRVRISSCGVFDILAHEAKYDLAMLQQEDLALFARLVLSLCCNNVSAMSTLTKSLEVVSRHYSPEIKNVILFLIPRAGPLRSIQQLFDTIGNQVAMEVDSAHLAVDQLQDDLMKELENARLIRLLCKFGFINERPEFDRDPRWSETGDRYIIKLFRDYVFHQVDENGNPVVNLSHVLTCLNKLDAGADERIMLVSRDEQSCLVVSYREIKSCIEAAFGDLARGTR